MTIVMTNNNYNTHCKENTLVSILMMVIIHILLLNTGIKIIMKNKQKTI